MEENKEVKKITIDEFDAKTFIFLLKYAKRYTAYEEDTDQYYTNLIERLNNDLRK